MCIIEVIRNFILGGPLKVEDNCLLKWPTEEISWASLSSKKLNDKLNNNKITYLPRKV